MSKINKTFPIVCLFMTLLMETLTAVESTMPTNEWSKAGAAERRISVKENLNCPPLFATKAKTLDPLDLARESWKGWISKRGIPWGDTNRVPPDLRMPFDNRALPWPSIKTHEVDGADNNNRTTGGLALLHAMFGDEMKNDPAEAGILAYLRVCTDPVSGIPFNPDKMPRECAMGHGEFVKNLFLMYHYTGDKSYLEGAKKGLDSLRKYAAVNERPGLGKVATYHQGSFVSGSAPLTSAPDPSLGGWLHLVVGWNLWAFAESHEITGDTRDLDLAVALGNRLLNTEANGNDGAFRPDGSFGGTDRQRSPASWHMHGHTHCLPGLMLLGKELIRTGQREKGLEFIDRVDKVCDWLYDPARNPDAGSMTGWLGEWLAIAWQKKDGTDCEGCTMGDMVQATVALGEAARLDPSLARLDAYWDRAEQIFTSQLNEQVFRLTPQYLKVMRECIEKRVGKEMPGADSAAKAGEVEKRYQAGVATAQRMVGQPLGTCGFPDWVNLLKSDLDPELPGIHMQGCCADATIRAAHAIWEGTVTGTETETRVNLPFNRKSPLANVVSCLPHRGELDITVGTAKKVLVRVPAWAPKPDVKAYVAKKPVAVQWDGQYVVFDKVTKGQLLTVTHPLRIAEVKETIYGTEYTEKWRGNTIVDIAPKGKWIPMFNRPQLDTEALP